MDVSLNTIIPKTIQYNVVSYKIVSVNIELFNSCTMFIIFNNDNGSKIAKNFSMTTEQYLNWNNDDNYIIDLINDNLETILSE
jgi:hypothetical protein